MFTPKSVRSNKSPKRRRARRARGKFDTPEELQVAVLLRWKNTRQTTAQIARATGVSASTVNNILDSKGGWYSPENKP